MKADVIPATADHIAIIAARARPADVAELWAIGRVTPTQCMERGLRLSITTWTGMLDDVPACMFGATPYSMLSGIGIPWMVGSDGLKPLKAQRQLLKKSEYAMSLLRRQFPMLINVVDDRNDCAMRWLRWLGFNLLDPAPMGPDKLPFRPFYLESETPSCATH